ncbi:MAG: sigma-70 family RNA polymerase sigma factor [Pseudohongiellaceae bacterium]
MTEEELMKAICSGNQTAYQTVVKQHLPSISHYAFRLLGNSKDTEDIAQETFLKLWTNATSWNPKKAKLSTWLHRITHNLCIDYLRKHGRLQTQANFDEADEEKLIEPHIKDTEREKLQTLSLALNQLPENQRSAIMLCTMQNFSNQEAADIMSVSVKALESTLARARRSLRVIIQEFDKQQPIEKLLSEREQL